MLGAPSHRSCDLLLKATPGVTIAVVSSRERKRRQPGLATDDPAFAVFPQDAVTIDGETRDYAGRFFCPRCGSSIFARTADEIEVNGNGGNQDSRRTIQLS